MSSPKENDNDAGDKRAVVADEETPLLLIPSEISFHHPRQSSGFHDDDNTIPSELSTLVAPSTLTPNGNGYDPNIQCNPNSYGGGYPSSGKTSTESSVRFNKAFQLAALLGFLSIGILFGADVVYMMASAPPEDVGHPTSAMNPTSAMSMDALNTSVRGGMPGVETASSDVRAYDNIKRSKKTKAAKKKKHKAETYNDDEVDHVVVPSKRDSQKLTVSGPESGDETDDELIATTAKRATPSGTFTPDWSAQSEDNSSSEVLIPEASHRCPYVIETFEQQNEGVTNYDFLHEKYKAQSADSNVFYRATALLFWKDFGAGNWGKDQGASINFEDMVLLNEARYEDGSSMSPMSTSTWTTGDQHLSNFGAWRNRGGEVVFSVNDFDEAAIYDFHIDVLRIAVSIAGHGFKNGFNEEEVREALEAFTYTYVKTATDYVGGDRALIYELNPNTSTGMLRDFLSDVSDARSTSRMLHKFTEVGSDGVRRFTRNDSTRLVDVPKEIEEKIRAEMTSTRYGASMMKMGWKVRGWDDDFFTVLDVARRVGSGIGSYGVDRFFVLLKGEDMLLDAGHDGPSVILDVKFEPVSAVSRILEDKPDIQAWYGHMFINESDRAAQAQKRLTSYTDPYVGYLVIDGDSYIVRQRSPYKNDFDYDTLTNHRAYNEFMEQIAVATATAHVRGSVAKSPGQFKHVIKLLLAGDRNRSRWSKLVADIALSYRKQVLLDFECFKEYVKENFP